MSAGSPVPAVRAYARTVVDPRHDGKRVEHATGPNRSLAVPQPTSSSAPPVCSPGSGPGDGSIHGTGERSIATTAPRGNAPPCATDSRITPTLRLGRAARTCQDRPPHPGEGHGQKERQEGAERKEVPEGAVGAGRPGRSSDNRRSVRESATEEELVGRLGHASETHGASRAAPTEGSTGSPPPDQRSQGGLSVIREAAAIG